MGRSPSSLGGLRCRLPRSRGRGRGGGAVVEGDAASSTHAVGDDEQLGDLVDRDDRREAKDPIGSMNGLYSGLSKTTSHSPGGFNIIFND